MLRRREPRPSDPSPLISLPSSVAVLAILIALGVILYLMWTPRLV